MIQFTKLEIITKVEEDLDIQDEEIVLPAEMTGYLQAAVRDATALIQTIEEDYFLTFAWLALVTGTQLYTLPADIYASKIRGINYRLGTRQFPIRRIRNLKKFLEILDSESDTTTDPVYRYFIVNRSAAAGVEIELLPASRETSAQNVRLWYWREANILVNDADKCDIPEFINYIFAHVKKSCRAKMNNGVAPPDAIMELKDQERLMLETLERMCPDNDTIVEADTSTYDDHT